LLGGGQCPEKFAGEGCLRLECGEKFFLFFLALFCEWVLGCEVEFFGAGEVVVEEVVAEFVESGLAVGRRLEDVDDGLEVCAGVGGVELGPEFARAVGEDLVDSFEGEGEVFDCDFG